MRILVDCDVLLDVVLQRSPHDLASGDVLDWCLRHPGQVCTAWHTLANLNYLSGGSGRKFIEDLLRFVEVARADTHAMRTALSFPMKDLEDAMQAAAAVSFGAGAIVTRNIKDFKRSPVTALTPEAFLKSVAP